EVGPSLEVLLAEDKAKGFKTTLTIPVRAVFSTDFLRLFSQGWTFSPRFNFDLFEKEPAKGWNLGMGFGPVFGDQTFQQYYYRVDQSYANPGRPSYSPSGGYGGLQLTTYVGKNFNKFRINLFTRVDYLNGAAFSDSPLVKSNITILTGFSLSYFFWESETLVEADR
ncbi:MAG: hypothetical protein C0407_06355, partial [Desulfobacca sp.]|nr:hypothetical protein [Desulfobacca sp.]